MVISKSVIKVIMQIWKHLLLGELWNKPPALLFWKWIGCLVQQWLGLELRIHTHILHFTKKGIRHTIMPVVVYLPCFFNGCGGETIFPVNVLDLIRKHFGYCQLWPLWPACIQNQAGSDFLHLKAWIILCKTNWPGSYLDGLGRFWPNASSPIMLCKTNWPGSYPDGLIMFCICPEASQWAKIIGLGACWQNTTGPQPDSHFHTWLRSSTDSLHRIVQNQPRSDFVPADCIRCGPDGPASGHRF